VPDATAIEDPQSSAMPARAACLVDGHVHLHDCFAVPDVLDAAAANFAAAAKSLGLPRQPTGCMLLAESRGVDQFARLADGTAACGAWRVSPTAEPVSLLARRPGAMPIVLVAGRQIVSRERLEVLAIGTRATFADGRPLDEALAGVRAADAVAVVPWGVGKWQGARGRRIADLLERDRDQPLFAGDNGGRLGLAPRPKLFARAQRSGVPVLAGSDPLPSPDQLAKVGGYGFVAEVDLDAPAPFAALRGYLEGLATSPRTFGSLESLPGFVRSQLAMQVQKRLRQRVH
jgi:hypothetical protein